MQSFEYFSPTRVVFGKGAEDRVAELVKAAGGKRVLIQYGQGSAEKSGLLARVVETLKQAGLAVFLLGGVQPNPRLSLVRQGIELCRSESIDFLLAVGGGSAIDSCKAIGMGACLSQADVWDLYLKKAKPAGCLPIGVVLTIAAAGSETGSSSVITNEDGGIKRGLNCEDSIPKFAIMNPELTYSLPTYQTACGVVDILMHTIDRYFSHQADNEMTDVIAEGLLQVVLRAGRKALDTPDDYHARSELMWAGSLSHNTLTGLGRTPDFSVHQLGHELSGMFDAAHGATLSAMFGSWARFACRRDLARFARFARRIWNIQLADIEQIAYLGIAATETYFMGIGMPTSIPQLLGRSVSEREICELAHKCTFFGTRKIGTFAPAAEEDVRDIYRAANIEP